MARLKSQTNSAIESLTKLYVNNVMQDIRYSSEEKLKIIGDGFHSVVQRKEPKSNEFSSLQSVMGIWTQSIINNPSYSRHEKLEMVLEGLGNIVKQTDVKSAEIGYIQAYLQALNVYEQLQESKPQKPLPKRTIKKESKSEKKDQILIKDIRFKDLYVDSLDASQLPLKQGCYLRPTHLQKSTGISRFTIYEKLAKVGAKKKTVGNNETWYFMNQEMYEEIQGRSKSDRKTKDKPQKEREKSDSRITIHDKNGNTIYVNHLEVAELPLNKGCYLTQKQIASLTGLSIPTISIKLKRLKLETMQAEDEKALLYRVDLIDYENLAGKNHQQKEPINNEKARISQKRNSHSHNKISLENVIQQAGSPKPSNIEVYRVSNELGIALSDTNPILNKEDAKRLLLALRKERE